MADTEDERTSTGSTVVPSLGGTVSPSRLATPDAFIEHAEDDPIALEEPGRYTLLEELARGGQSTVHVAFDRQLGRQVAFKVLRREADGSFSASAVSRFIREGRITAQLDHPGIAPVHEVGRRADGALYATQKLIRGKTLAAALAERTTLRARLELMPALVRIVEAVAYAHSRGVVHRDLKPANAMVGALGEAVVLDWGVARTGKAADEPTPVDSMLDSQVARTRSGALIGTPMYMSPEQASGLTESIDARSDVWSLGIILYELLTGSVPFQSSSLNDVINSIVTGQPPSPRHVVPEAPAELVAIVERALRKEPAGRYPSAREMAKDLSAWLTGGRVSAHEYSSWELLGKFVRRRRGVVTVAAVALVGLMGLAALWRVEADTARRSAGDARRALARALIDKAEQAEKQAMYAEAAALFGAARLEDDSVVARLGVARNEPRAITPVEKLDLEALGCAPLATDSPFPFLPNLELIRDELFVSCIGLDGGLRRVDARGKVLFESGKTWASMVTSGETGWLQDEAGRAMVLRFTDAGVEARDFATRLPEGPSLAALSRDGRTVAIAVDGGATVLVYSTEDGTLLRQEHDLPRSPYSRHALSGDGSRLVVTRRTGIDEIEVSTGKNVRHLNIDTSDITNISHGEENVLAIARLSSLTITPRNGIADTISSQGKQFAGQRLSNDGTVLHLSFFGFSGVVMADVLTRRVLARSFGVNPSGSPGALSDNRVAIMTFGGFRPTVSVFTFPGTGSRAVKALLPWAFPCSDPEDTLLAYIDGPMPLDDQHRPMAQLKVVRLEDGRPVFSRGLDSLFTHPGFCSIGRKIVAFNDSQAKAMNASDRAASVIVGKLGERTQEVLGELPSGSTGATVAVSGDDAKLAVGTPDALVLYELPQGVPVWKQPLEGPYRAIAFVGPYVASTAGDGLVLFDVASGAPTKTLPGGDGCSILYHRTGSDVLYGLCWPDANGGGSILWWDVSTGEGLGRLDIPLPFPECLTVSPGMDLAAVCSDEAGLRVFDLHRKTLLARIPATSPNWVGWAAFTPDGKGIRYIDGDLQTAPLVAPEDDPTVAVPALFKTLGLRAEPDGTIIRDGW